ncbi:spoU rRNA Methylase family protein, partial [Chlamydia psittaci 06-1683]
ITGIRSICLLLIP